MRVVVDDHYLGVDSAVVDVKHLVVGKSELVEERRRGVVGSAVVGGMREDWRRVEVGRIGRLEEAQSTAVVAGRHLELVSLELVELA
jgi:hypothetical protein